jgi:multidrug resistance protein, MATE family
MKKKKITLWVLLSLAIPSIASAILNNFYRVVDQYAVQWLGTNSQAAIASSTFILIAAYSIFLIISGGIAPLVSRATGAKDRVKCAELIGEGCKAMALTSTIYCVFLVTTAPLLADAVGLQGESASQLIIYLRWLGITGFFIAFGPLIDAIYISVGNTKFPMKLQFLSTVTNAIFNWLFIYEMGWGIAGAACASGLSRGIACIIGMHYLKKDFIPDWNCNKWLRKILKIGYPIAMGNLTYALVYWVLLKVAISPLGPEVNAALGIGFSALEGIAWPIYAGVMMAVMSLIGRNLGAKDYEAVEQILKVSFPTSTALGITMAAIFWYGATPLCSLFTTDPQTLEQAVLYARILAFSQVFVAWEALSEGVLVGAGATRAVFWCSVPFNIMRVPLGWYLAIFLGWKAFGVWWAINFSTYCKAVLKMWIISRGKWKSISL